MRLNIQEFLAMDQIDLVMVWQNSFSLKREDITEKTPSFLGMPKLGDGGPTFSFYLSYFFK